LFVGNCEDGRRGCAAAFDDRRLAHRPRYDCAYDGGHDQHRRYNEPRQAFPRCVRSTDLMESALECCRSRKAVARGVRETSFHKSDKWLRQVRANLAERSQVACGMRATDVAEGPRVDGKLGCD